MFYLVKAKDLRIEDWRRIYEKRNEKILVLSYIDDSIIITYFAMNTVLKEVIKLEDNIWLPKEDKHGV